MERKGVPRIFAILTIILVVVVLLSGIAIFFSVQLSNIHIDVAAIKEKVLQKGDNIELFFEETFGINLNTMEYYLGKVIESLFSLFQSQFGNIFSATTTTLFQFFILPVFTFFILFYRTKTAFFILRLTGKERRSKTVKILREVTTVTTRYLGGIVAVVGILAVLNSVGLTIIGVPHAIVLGVGAAILNLIPYFGTLLGALIPLFYVLFAVPDPLSMTLKVILMFIIVQFLENNIITPNVVGGNVKLNPFTIIISLLIGNLVWGVAGMLIIVPFLAILKIVMRNIESLKPFAYLISSRGLEKHSISNYRIFRKLFKKGKK
jgi:predicted PurR-regulated permease PerM